MYCITTHAFVQALFTYYMHMRVCYAYMCSAYVYMRVMYARVLCVAHTRSGVKYVCCILAYANSPTV